MSEIPLPPTTTTSVSSETPIQSNRNPPPRRSRPRVREVSSRFMSPSVSTPLRRSHTDLRPRYGDENRSDSLNRRSVSPVRSGKPRSAVKLFKETSRPDTPAPTPTPGRTLLRCRNWDSAASKLLRVNMSSNNNGNVGSGEGDGDGDDGSSIDGDNESVKSEPCNEGRGKGTGTGTGMGKVARSLHLPPKGPGVIDVKKAVRKGGSREVDDVHRLKMLYNKHLQWRYANAKAEALIIARKNHVEKHLYTVGVRISELRDSVTSKRAEYRILKGLRTLSAILDAQLPYLDEWSALDESYSSSLLELSNGLLNVLSQLPIDGNMRVDMKEIEEALHSALKVIEMICLQVQSFTSEAEHVGCLISDLARVSNGEITLVDECGDLLSKTHSSQVEECSLKVQMMQLHRLKLDSLEDGQH